ncbi:MAG TPA: SDR family NAD(P)-dependent oxidoreductase, partial [Tepidisphaeraceae bacterium]|nr:SDR family NAD(P)-dependent oxidoreductase [Tepidisphaeraceae bacterium]
MYGNPRFRAMTTRHERARLSFRNHRPSLPLDGRRYAQPSRLRALTQATPERSFTMARLSGKVAVITGATSGMALATAKLFVEEGAYVFITGRRQEKLDSAVKEIGRNVTGVQGDAGNLSDLDRLYKTVKEKKGHIDVLFASAGIGDMNSPIGSVTEKGFDDTFNVNVRGTLFTVQKALPLLKDGASIILNGSIAGMTGFPGLCVYNASKAAVRSFARTWTSELKARKIRVNVISPGPIDTAVFERV